MADKEQTIPIPEAILNDVRMLQNQIGDYSKQIRYFEEKKRFTHAKLWDLIGEKMADTRGVPCSLNMGDGTVTVNKRPAIEKFLGRMLGGDGDDD